MTPVSLKTRLLLFFYSNANLAGCLLALVGPALLFAGVIERGWLLITAGLYLVGYSLAGQDQLSLLDDKLREIVANVAASDAQALVANGKFLEVKFRQPDFLAS